MKYVDEIQHLVNSALKEMSDAIAAGKLVSAPANKELFLCRWVAQAAKKQRFHHCVGKDLQRWIQRARSAGKNAGITAEFEKISSVYAERFPITQPPKHVARSQVDNLIECAKRADWMVHTDYAIDRKVKVVSDGQCSFAICSEALKASFNDSGILIKPLSLYARGPEAELMNWLNAASLSVTKVTDYKSIVKYHAEYKLWPDNEANCLIVMYD